MTTRWTTSSPEYEDGRQVDIAVMEPLSPLRLHVQEVGFFGALLGVQPVGWKASGFTEQSWMGGNEGGLNQTNAVLATLIEGLKALGILGT